MPKAQQDYYYSYARQNFVSFSDEDDPDRINFLIEVVCVCVCVCVGMHVCSVHSLQTCVCMCVNAYVHACVLMRVPAHCGCGERGLAGRKPDARACVRQRGREHIKFIVKKYDLDMKIGGAHFDKQ